MIFALKPSLPLSLSRASFPPPSSSSSSSLGRLLPLSLRPLIRRERKGKKEGGEGEFGCGQSVLERSLRRPHDRPLLPHRATDGRSLGRRVRVPPYPHNERTNDLRERRGVSQGSSILFIHPFMLPLLVLLRTEEKPTVRHNCVWAEEEGGGWPRGRRV